MLVSLDTLASLVSRDGTRFPDSCFREQGVQHTPSDALASRTDAEAWMRAYGLLMPGHLLSKE